MPKVVKVLLVVLLLAAVVVLLFTTVFPWVEERLQQDPTMGTVVAADI